MPRLVIRIALVDDDHTTLLRQDWSPLSYEDFNNPALFNRPDGIRNEDSGLIGTQVNEIERSLIERIRTAIDRSLLRFARGERRRFATETVRRPVQQYDVNDFAGPYDQQVVSLIENLPEEASFQSEILSSVIPKEDKRLLEPPVIRRKSRYERNPVI